MTIRRDSPRQVVAISLTTSTNVSAAVDLGGYRVMAITMPASSTDWTAANLTFRGSEDNSTFLDLYDESGNEFTVTAAGGRQIVLGAAASLALGAQRYLQVRSGTATTGVNQTTGRTINLTVTPV